MRDQEYHTAAQDCKQDVASVSCKIEQQSTL